MVDYNDGEWHGWDGGVCPVHPESVVDVKFNDGEECEEEKAEVWGWESRFVKIIAFRVTKPYVGPPKPREFWINEYADGYIAYPHDSKEKANISMGEGRIRCIHVREVIEE